MASEERDEKMIVDARWLGTHRSDASVVLVDTRPAEEFANGHLEGARHFDPFPFHHSDTSEAGMRQFRGQLEWIFSALGITGEETVVFYENDSGMLAAVRDRLAPGLALDGCIRAHVADKDLRAARSAALRAGALHALYPRRTIVSP